MKIGINDARTMKYRSCAAMALAMASARSRFVLIFRPIVDLTIFEKLDSDGRLSWDCREIDCNDPWNEFRDTLSTDRAVAPPGFSLFDARNSLTYALSHKIVNYYVEQTPSACSTCFGKLVPA